MTHEHCLCSLLVFTPEQSSAHAHLCLPAAVGYLGVSKVQGSHKLAALLSTSRLSLCCSGLCWPVTHKPELRVLIQMPSNSLCLMLFLYIRSGRGGSVALLLLAAQSAHHLYLSPCAMKG